MSEIKNYTYRDNNYYSDIPASTTAILSNNINYTIPLCAKCTYLECKDTDATKDTYYCCILDTVYRYSEDAPKEPSDCKNYCVGEPL